MLSPACEFGEILDTTLLSLEFFPAPNTYGVDNIFKPHLGS